MDQIFLLKVLLSFFIGGLWAIATTVIADHLGSKLGGLVGGLPSTVMFGLFFIGWTQGVHASVEATTIMPIIGGIGCLFLCINAGLLKIDIWISLIVSLFMWFVLSLFLVVIKFNNYFISITGYILLLLFSFIVIEYFLKVKSVKGKKIKYTPGIILFRGLLSGTIVAFTVYIAKAGGPVFGGIFAIFPALFTSTIIITYFSQGYEFASAMTKSLMIGGISVIIYSIAARFSYSHFGLLTGTIIPIFIAFLSSYFIYLFIIRRLS